MIKKIDPIEHVIQNRKMYLGRDDVVPDILVSFIVDDALVLGATTVLIKKYKEWWLMASDFDWLSQGHEQNTTYLFSNLVPLENGGQNSLRREIILMAFTKNIVTWRKDASVLDIIKGECKIDLINLFRNEFPDLKIERTLGFSL